MKNTDITPYFEDLLEELTAADGARESLFVKETRAAIAGLSADFTTNDELIEAVQQANRIATITAAGLLGNRAFKSDLDKYAPPSWKDSKPLPAGKEAQIALGRRLYNIPEGFENPQAVINAGDGANYIIGAVIDEMRAKDIPFLIAVSDETFSRLVLKHADAKGLQRLAERYLRRYEKITHICTARPSTTPKSPVEQDEAKDVAYGKATAAFHQKVMRGDVMFTLTSFPTEEDAKVDDIPYEEYLALYFDMCDQPDTWIEKANEVLIARLEGASTVRFTNDFGTDVSMSLIDTDGRHFTFANSQTKKNIPGSEVFSAARRDSINGIVASQGKFISKTDNDGEIHDLVLTFENGRIVKFSAAKGGGHFQEFLDRNPNNAFTGELGIGTNPHLKRHVVNNLLVEKISGSFHLALGAAYQITNYLGKPVHMDNGNRSHDHWDVTTMLGDMYLDDELVMKDGQFLDPALDVLNRGWLAVPVEQRPERWKKYKGPYTGKAS